MAISLPEALTIESSGKYIVSIRLRPDGLSFSGYIPSGHGSFFYTEAPLDRGSSYVPSLKEFFFSNDFLTWKYKEVRIVVPSQYTLVPKSIFREKQKEAILRFNFTAPEDRCLHNTLGNEEAELVFGIDNETYEFFSRSFINPLFIHSLTPTLHYWKKQSYGHPFAQMYVSIHDKTVDIACYKQSDLLFVNSFRIEQADDVLYYILYVWRQLKLDQQQDRLSIYGEPSLRNNIMQSLFQYIKEVGPIEIPTEAYLLGPEISKAPFDLIALSVCEL